MGLATAFEDQMRSQSYLDGLVVNEQTVEGGKGLAGAVRMVEQDVRNAAADTTGSVVDLDLLDLAD